MNSGTASSSTEPPSYSSAVEHGFATISAASTGLSLIDLRAQILANSTIVKPRLMSDTDYPLELVVAKTSARQHYGMVLQKSSAGPSRKVGYSSDASKLDNRIVIKGEPKDTIIQALEWILEQTELMVQRMVENDAIPMLHPLMGRTTWHRLDR